MKKKPIIFYIKTGHFPCGNAQFFIIVYKRFKEFVKIKTERVMAWDAYW